MKGRIKYLLLATMLLALTFIPGCMGTGVGSENFDIGKLLTSPFGIIALLGILFIMWKKGKK